MTLRPFISLVPEFQQNAGQGLKKSHDEAESGAVNAEAGAPAISPEIATAIREYISSDVLKACLTSFHEPYFVEVQKELASLIAAIYVHYSPSTMTPRNVLLSLPNINAAELERLNPYMAKPGSHSRQQRAIVLEILKDLKGVSVSEMGKLAKNIGGLDGSGRIKRPGRSKMAQGFMTAPAGQSNGATRIDQVTGDRKTTPDALDGVYADFRPDG